MSEPDPVGRNTWLDYRSGQEFEHQLIDRKTSWFLTSQAILFAAYGVSLREMPDIGIGHQFRDVTASAGMALTGIAVIGVLSLVVAKIIHWRQYRDFFVRHASLPEPYANRELPWGAATWTTPITLLPDMLYPFVFFMAWFSLAGASG